MLKHLADQSHCASVFWSLISFLQRAPSHWTFVTVTVETLRALRHFYSTTGAYFIQDRHEFLVRGGFIMLTAHFLHLFQWLAFTLTTCKRVYFTLYIFTSTFLLNSSSSQPVSPRVGCYTSLKGQKALWDNGGKLLKLFFIVLHTLYLHLHVGPFLVHVFKFYKAYDSRKIIQPISERR